MTDQRILVLFWIRSRVSKIDFIIKRPINKEKIFSFFLQLKLGWHHWLLWLCVIKASQVNYSPSLVFFQFNHEKLKNKSLVCRWFLRLMRRRRVKPWWGSSRRLIGFQALEDQFGALCANVSAHLCCRRRSTAVDSRRSSVTTEGLRRTAAQHHWTCAPSRTGGTGRTGPAECCCSDCRCLCRWSHSLQQEQKQDVSITSQYLDLTSQNCYSLFSDRWRTILQTEVRNMIWWKFVRTGWIFSLSK